KVPRRTAVRHRANVPLLECAEAGRRQRLEALEASDGIVNPEAEGKTAPRRIEMANGVEEIRDSSFARLEQRRQEALRARHLLANHRFPQRGHVVAVATSARQRF